jgi:CcmD family protein
MPALPLDEAGKYVAGAYMVFITLVLVYIAVIGAKVQRLDRELSELAEHERQRSERETHASDAAHGTGPSTAQSSLKSPGP